MSRQPKINRYYYVQQQPVLLNESTLNLTASIRPQPIRLTKQWLTAFGFRPDPRGHTWFFGEARLVPGTNCWLCFETRRYVQYVHELQDLFEEHYQTALSVQSHRSTTTLSTGRYALSV